MEAGVIIMIEIVSNIYLALGVLKLPKDIIERSTLTGIIFKLFLKLMNFFPEFIVLVQYESLY